MPVIPIHSLRLALVPPFAGLAFCATTAKNTNLLANPLAFELPAAAF